LLFVSSDCGVHGGVDALILNETTPTFSALNNIVCQQHGQIWFGETVVLKQLKTTTSSKRDLVSGTYDCKNPITA